MPQTIWSGEVDSGISAVTSFNWWKAYAEHATGAGSSAKKPSVPTRISMYSEQRANN